MKTLQVLSPQDGAQVAGTHLLGPGRGTVRAVRPWAVGGLGMGSE